MPEFLARAALLPDGWAADVRILADAAGTITAVEAGTARAPGADLLRGVVIPGIPNLHGHAFQRAMAGEAERRGPPGTDSLWTWRETVARFAGLIGPEEAEAVAAMAYVELLEQGFTAVCEFHTLHHRPDGSPYAEPAEMALRHLEAARATGMGITLLPCLFRHGGIFGKPPPPGHQRFVNDLDGYARIIEGCRRGLGDDPQMALGLAPHSLRGVTPLMLSAIGGMAGPIHIHVAEQRREVEECLAAVHARPVEWLLDNAPVDDRWCLIHATHISPQEIEDLAASGAVVGLCPSSEASLGDGIFPLQASVSRGLRFGIGTDSHVGTAPRDEMRLLETVQRLALNARAVATTEASPHPGRLLLDAALAGGAQAAGRALGEIAPGRHCDLVELDPDHPSLVARGGDRLLDAWIFSGSSNPVRTVVCGGRRVVEAGRHLARIEVMEAFAQTMRRLLA